MASIWVRLRHVLLDELLKSWEDLRWRQGSRECIDDVESGMTRCIVLDVFRFGFRGYGHQALENCGCDVCLNFRLFAT